MQRFYVEENGLYPVIPNWKMDTLCPHVCLVRKCYLPSYYDLLLKRMLYQLDYFLLLHYTQITARMIWPVWRRRSLALWCLFCLLTQRRKFFKEPTTQPLDWHLEFSPGDSTIQQYNIINDYFGNRFIILFKRVIWSFYYFLGIKNRLKQTIAFKMTYKYVYNTFYKT